MRIERWEDKAARQLRSEAAKRNLDARQSSSLQGREIERGVESNKAELEAKSVSEAAKQLGSEAAKCNILISPLEGEKKFLSELCELRNFREGYKKYKTLDRATECAMTNVGDKKGKIKMNENNLQQKQPNNPVAFLENKHSLLPDTVFSRFTSHFSRKRIAFTLAEVLITLGIIGVIASLTLPNLIANYQEKVATVRLKKVYSTISNAYNLILEDEGDPTQWNDVESWEDISKKFAKYINKAKVCNVGDTGCFKHVPRKDLTGKTVNSLSQTGAIVFSDGAVISFESPVSLENSLPCNNLNLCFTIVTDINGDKQPNQWGVDTFIFHVGKNRILPRGAASTHGANRTCIPTGSSLGGWWNGSGCGAWVIYKENMDYLKCAKGNNNYCGQKYYF